MSALLAEMHPDRITRCFRNVGAAGLPDGLLGNPRFAGRLAHIVTRHYDLADVDETAEEADRALAALSQENLQQLAIRAGVVVHARRFVQEIRGPVLVALTERFGLEALDDARRHADLAMDRAKTDDFDALETDIAGDGMACLSAWIEALPVALRKRVRLKWPNDHAVPVTDDATLRDHGPTILRRLGAVESRIA